MKPYYTNTKLPFYLLSFLMVTFLVSCGTTQTITHSEDGIYADDTTERTQRRVVVANERKSKEYNDNYFTKELQRLEELNDSDIITDVDSYKSYGDEEVEEIIEEDRPQTRITYNEPWGYNDNNADIVININTGFGYNPYWSSYYGYGYGYGWNRWHRWNRWEYITPYYSPYHWNGGYYPPYRYGNYYRNTRRGANLYRGRYSVASNSRRGYRSSNRRSVNSTRRTSTARRASTIRRNTSTRSTRNVRSTRGNNNSIRRTSPTRSTRNTRSRSTRTIRNYNGNKRTRSTRGNSSTRNTRNYTTRGVKKTTETRATRSVKRTRTAPKRNTNRYSQSSTPRHSTISRSSSSRGSSSNRRSTSTSGSRSSRTRR